jgi:hypothetical protein
MKIQATCWPTREQELLLQACLLPGERALEAWHQWKSVADIDDVDLGSFRLLPLLYRNLSTHGVDEPIMSKLKGIYRQTWYKNQMLFHRIAALLRSLQDAGIQTLLLKGAALTVLYYRDYGLRPMSDFDLLVPTEEALAAVTLLTELGWQPKKRPLEGFTNPYLSMTHAHSFVDANGHEIDFHWHVLFECCYAGADRDFWDGAVAVRVRDVEARALNPTDQLLHVCVHGAVRNVVPPFRWAADAMAILRTSEAEIDWDRLGAQAERRRLILPLRDTLDFLSRVLNAPIPVATLSRLHNMPVSWVERIEYQAVSEPPGPLHTLPRTWTHYVRWERGTRDGRLEPRFLGFPRYLQHYWGKKHLWQVPIRFVVRASQKIHDAMLA